MDLTDSTDSTEPGDAVDVSPIEEYLKTVDLDLLLARRQQIDTDALSEADQQLINGVLDEWTDLQAVSNLLMHPRIIPGEHRNAEVQRGLDDVENPYLRLAAVVGLGDLDLSLVNDNERHRFVHSLVDLIDADGTICAERASFALVWLMRQPDAPDVIACLSHPSERVRHNIVQGLLEMLGPSGLAALLELPGFVSPEVQASARSAIDQLGIDLTAPADELRRPLLLTYLPNYPEFDPAQ